MYEMIKPRGARAMCGWPLLALLAAVPLASGCANPPPLSTGGGSTGPNITGIKIPSAVPAALAIDNGVGAGPARAGGGYAGLSVNDAKYFDEAKKVFAEKDSVSGNVTDFEGSGLGPTFNGDSCAMCHAQPEVGGTSPNASNPAASLQKVNPQIALATREGATNTVPIFVTMDGPAREARFKTDGGVHGLFTIAGRTDAPGCSSSQMQQPDFVTAAANDNLIFRIATPVFGLGLVENTPDATLEANLANNAAAKQAAGISGVFNRSGNDGTITRFGWKAQNKSLAVFAGEAYNVEQGVSNELFMNERSAIPSCVFNSSPEDHTNNEGLDTGDQIDMASDAIAFAMFMRLSAAPTRAAGLDPTGRGEQLFDSTGCSLCHTKTLKTGKSPYGGMSNVDYSPFSDFALHHMGETLADGIQQGAASGDMFRTAPLWGVGQRAFFLHDGRFSSIVDAIEAHSSNGSEANSVILAFNGLSGADQQLIVDFLRGL
jgi:CxxC motif-containing protein (DUF1111 family)